MLINEKTFEFFLISSILISSFIFTDLVVYKLGLDCISEKVVGIRMGTCGITRSILSTGHFEFQKALEYNPLGIYFYTLFLIDFIYLSLNIFINWDNKFLRRMITNLTIVGGFLIVIMTIFNILTINLNLFNFK